MNMGWAREISLRKLRPDCPQMVAYKRDLSRIVGVLCDDALYPAICGFGEDVGGCVKVERHDVGAAFRDGCLPRRILRFDRECSPARNCNRGKEK